MAGDIERSEGYIDIELELGMQGRMEMSSSGEIPGDKEETKIRAG